MDKSLSTPALNPHNKPGQEVRETGARDRQAEERKRCTHHAAWGGWVEEIAIVGTWVCHLSCYPHISIGARIQTHTRFLLATLRNG